MYFLWKFSFLKFYEMGSTKFDFGGIVHVKVKVIAYQKIKVRLMGGNFVWDAHLDQCGWLFGQPGHSKRLLKIPF